MRIFLSMVILFFFSCKEQKRFQNDNLTDYQNQVNNYFKDASVSPLEAKDLKNFQGLDFFGFDSSYVVYAKVKETPMSPAFKMKTTTNTPADFRIFGQLTFNLKGNFFTLNVYENLDYINIEGYENYLFLPFLDQTNGFETYGGGRYIDLYRNEKDSILIDFNKAYNPQCVYNENFSCPIVPRENNLEIKINAGVKNFLRN